MLKPICIVLSIIVFVESAYILKINSDKSNSLPQMSYYGNSGKVEVEVSATKDFYRFKNGVNAYGLFPYELPYDERENGNLFLWGRAFFYTSAGDFGAEAGKITIAAGEESSVNINLIEKQENSGTETTREVFFYVDGTEDLEMDEITKCILTYGKNRFVVDMKPL